MNIGRMRKRVTLQSPSQSTDGYGDVATSWTDVGTYWAELTPTGGKEAVNAEQMLAASNYTIRMRYVGPIDPSMRLIYNNRVFNLFSVNDVEERHREYEILAREVVQPTTTP